MFRHVVFRFVPALAVAAALVAWFGMPYFDGLLTTWSRVNAESRAKSVMIAVEKPVSALIDRNERAPLEHLMTDMLHDSRIAAVALCRPDGTTIARTGGGGATVNCASDDAVGSTEASRIVEGPSGPMLAVRYESNLAGHVPFRLVIQQRLLVAGLDQAGWRNFVLAFAVVSTLILALLVALVAWWLLRSWVAVLVGDIRSGRFLDDAWSPRFSLPILSQLRKVLSEVEETQRREIDYRENWTPQALQQVVSEHLHSEQIIVVSNREPYSHILDADAGIHVQVPASGMVTALEPIMRACSGVWVAHGSGSADRQVVDRSDHVQVPPAEPAYTLRRVWLSQAEEQAYYYGFSNEGLWPLCHLAYVRPAFRQSDWLTYQSVNRKFADVVARRPRAAARSC